MRIKTCLKPYVVAISENIIEFIDINRIPLVGDNVKEKKLFGLRIIRTRLAVDEIFDKFKLG
jgi:hypothetical protein